MLPDYGVQFVDMSSSRKRGLSIHISRRASLKNGIEYRLAKQIKAFRARRSPRRAPR